jgi:hypothetical protein
MPGVEAGAARAQTASGGSEAAVDAGPEPHQPVAKPLAQAVVPDDPAERAQARGTVARSAAQGVGGGHGRGIRGAAGALLYATRSRKTRLAS